jgi:hypothetical protein
MQLVPPNQSEIRQQLLAFREELFGLRGMPSTPTTRIIIEQLARRIEAFMQDALDDPRIYVLPVFYGRGEHVVFDFNFPPEYADYLPRQ